MVHQGLVIMKTHFNNPDYAKLQNKHMSIFPPAIMFNVPKNKDKEEDTDSNNKYCPFEAKIDTDNEVDYSI